MGYYPSSNWLQKTFKTFNIQNDGNDKIEFEEFVAMYEFLRKVSHLADRAVGWVSVGR